MREQKLKIRTYVLLLSMISCVICGCTRREQLVLEAEDVTVSGQGSGVSDGNAFAAQSQSELAGSADAVSGVDASGVSDQESAGRPEASDVQQKGQNQSEDESVICVHVCGAVQNAGVYELPAGSRVYEAVKKAGGFTSEADESYVNQAQQLTDGAKLVIPTVEQVQSAAGDEETGRGEIGIVEQAAADKADGYGVNAGQISSTEEGSSSDGKININTATETQLCEIPGIGATRAAAIVAYRQESGGFRSIEDIMNVSGIKEGTFAKIKDSIKVN